MSVALAIFLFVMFSNVLSSNYLSDSLLLNKRNNNESHHDITYVDTFSDLSRNFTSTIDKVKKANSSHDESK